MKKRSIVLQILQIVLVLVLCSAATAVDTREIDRVRDKGVLNSEDFATIDKFVSDATAELVNTSDFTSIAKIRAVIVSRKSEQAQYAEQYSKSCFKHIGAALEQSRDIEPAQNGIKVRINLLILADSLKDERLADLAAGQLKDSSPVVRYWAVRALVGLVNPTKEVFAKLQETVPTASSEVVGLLVGFAASKDSPEAEELLLSVADERIERYAKWQVEEHQPDIKVLKALCVKMQGQSKQKKIFGARFAQLYSYAMQKYIKDIAGGDFLNEKQKRELISVLAEIEDKCIGELTSFVQAVIKRSVEENNPTVLLAEHERLFGDAGKSGEIPRKFGFDYGQDDSGSRVTTPKTLPERPAVNG